MIKRSKNHLRKDLYSIEEYSMDPVSHDLERYTGWLQWPVGEVMALPLGLRRREPAILTEAKNIASCVFPPNLLKTGQQFFCLFCLF